MTTYYAQSSGPFASVAWNDQPDGSGNSPSSNGSDNGNLPGSNDTAESNSYAIDLTGVSLYVSAYIFTASNNGGYFWASVAYAGSSSAYNWSAISWYSAPSGEYYGISVTPGSNGCITADSNGQSIDVAGASLFGITLQNTGFYSSQWWAANGGAFSGVTWYSSSGGASSSMSGTPVAGNTVFSNGYQVDATGLTTFYILGDPFEAHPWYAYGDGATGGMWYTQPSGGGASWVAGNGQNGASDFDLQGYTLAMNAGQPSGSTFGNGVLAGSDGHLAMILSTPVTINDSGQIDFTDLAASNIKSGVTIAGILGTASSGGAASPIGCAFIQGSGA